MQKAIVLHSVVPVRTQALETAEQSSQLLFSETCTILEEQPRWLRVQNDADGEQGWVDSKMLTPLSEQEWEMVQAASHEAQVAMPMAYAVSENNGQTIPLTAATGLMNYADGQFEVLGVRFRIDASMVAPKPYSLTLENLQNVVRFFLNTPYLWGGKNALGMDCSGFVQVVMHLFGYALPRNAKDQAACGTLVSSLTAAQAGDLAFFDHEDGKISHVGILLSPTLLIHCSGRVKLEPIDTQGIISPEQGGLHTHHLTGIRRLA